MRRMTLHRAHLFRLLTLMFCLCGIAITLLSGQTSKGSDASSNAAFAGTWKGTCQDGKALVLVSLRRRSGKVDGDISIGNVKFGASAEGSAPPCTATDQASSDHTKAIVNAAMESGKLTFETPQGSQFEMILTGPNTAKIRFRGTNVEDYYFEIHKTAE
ncbi:MAG TPA: hypothetical protein VGG59_14050 [Acidobacteriaceae bacterium]